MDEYFRSNDPLWNVYFSPIRSKMLNHKMANTATLPQKLIFKRSNNCSQLWFSTSSFKWVYHLPSSAPLAFCCQLFESRKKCLEAHYSRYSWYASQSLAFIRVKRTIELTNFSNIFRASAHPSVVILHETTASMEQM